MKLPVWLLALSATMLAQTISSFMGQCLPVVAPLMTASTGVAPERIGNLSSLTSLGSVLFLAFGSPLLARFGPIRSLQLGTLCAIVAMAVAALGWWPALLLSSVLLGIGYGPTPPAGSRILAATAPPQHRTLIFPSNRPVPQPAARWRACWSPHWPPPGAGPPRFCWRSAPVS